MIQAKELAPTHIHSLELMNELSETLESLTGDTGAASFDIESFVAERGIFIVVYEGDVALACGSFRRHDAFSCELKRMYSRRRGVGRVLLNELTSRARQMGYSRIVLSARRVNTRAIDFYLRNGFYETLPYGRYLARPESVCMEKYL
ncbi:GNAT family N-acetyltransferase [Hahella ganghwensis]|uniref:GNAT family N-acetyltransferase n=1 Tax=Hahella ganghwensis TaxID=286420 RepID=UPI00035FD99D|nr:GNAT family N-acetyltransferase [Hahella ganghwensis]